jgi:hypothetical protein
MIMMGMRLIKTKLNNMSGGHFDYAQYRINDIAVEIDEVIKSNDGKTLDEFGWEEGNEYSPEIIEKFKEAAHTLRQAQEMAQRVDWLLSGNDSEDNFLRRWDKEVRGYWTNNPSTGQQQPKLNNMNEQTNSEALHCSASWIPFHDAPSISPCLVTDGINVEKAKWKPRNKEWVFSHAKLRLAPTHWMPLPLPPNTPAQEGEINL